jgi:hypothetical protein
MDLIRARTTALLVLLAVLGAAVAVGWHYRWYTLDPVPDVQVLVPPVPVMSYEEYSSITHERPYLLRLRMGDGELVYLGVGHTRDPGDQQIDRLRSLWDEFRPTVALAESRLGFFVGGLGPGVKMFGEAGAVFALARADGVPIHTLEAPLDVEMQAVLTQWPAAQAAAYYVLRASLGRETPEAVEREAAQLVRKRTRWPGLEGSLDYPRLDSLMRAEFPNAADWRTLPASVTWPGRSDSFLNRVSTTVNQFRDDYMISMLATLLQRGERVFAVVGASHVVMQEPALRALPGVRTVE